MGHSSLSSFLDLGELSEWAHDICIISLFDLSSWNQNGIWIGCRAIHPPEHLEAAKNFLFTTLQGKALISKPSKDTLGWGKNGNYMVKEGYKKLSYDSSTAESIWKKVWKSDCIHKVNSFIGLLVHNKLLTTENLRKRGIASPSRCALCNSDSESTVHIFLQCSVSKQVWMSILPLGTSFRPPDAFNQLLVNWNKQFPGNLKKKPNLKRLWNTIPKNLCCQLWFARNRAIFKGDKVIPNRIVSKTVGMISEKLASKGIDYPDSKDLSKPISSWCNMFLKRNSP